MAVECDPVDQQFDHAGLLAWGQAVPHGVEIGQWGGDAIHDALDRAYFVDGLNLAKQDILLDIARQLGLPETDAQDVLAARAYKAAVDADWQRSRELGSTAVPTFVVGDRGLVGAQPYEALERLVVEAGARERS